MHFKSTAAALFFGCLMSFALAAEPTQAPAEEAVVLKPFVVEGSYTKVELKINFRYHMVWNGVKSLTFTSVPTSWGKAGVKVGDHLIRIDGQLVDGMKLRDFTHVLKKATGAPSATFEIQSSESNAIRAMEVIVKKGEEGSFTISF